MNANDNRTAANTLVVITWYGDEVKAWNNSASMLDDGRGKYIRHRITTNTTNATL
jgi:hypothetical protein